MREQDERTDLSLAEKSEEALRRQLSGYREKTYISPNPHRYAILSILFGVAGFVAGPFTSVLAIIFGHKFMKINDKQNLNGRPMAITGLILGYLITISTGMFLLSHFGIYH
jgi:uncharacterized membrane protein